MGLRGCPETSVRNYHYSVRNNPEDHSSHLRRGGSLKTLHKILFCGSRVVTCEQMNKHTWQSHYQDFCNFLCENTKSVTHSKVTMVDINVHTKSSHIWDRGFQIYREHACWSLCLLCCLVAIKVVRRTVLTVNASYRLSDQTLDGSNLAVAPWHKRLSLFHDLCNDNVPAAYSYMHISSNGKMTVKYEMRRIWNQS